MSRRILEIKGNAISCRGKRPQDVLTPKGNTRLSLGLTLRDWAWIRTQLGAQCQRARLRPKNVRPTRRYIRSRAGLQAGYRLFLHRAAGSQRPHGQPGLPSAAPGCSILLRLFNQGASRSGTARKEGGEPLRAEIHIVICRRDSWIRQSDQRG